MRIQPKHIKHATRKTGSWLKLHWKRASLMSVGVVAVLFIAVQVSYPSNRLPLYAVVDGVSVSAMTSDLAKETLDTAYKNAETIVSFGDTEDATKRTIPLKDLGVTVDVTEKVNQQSYAWWLRLVPTSVFWAHAVTPQSDPSYARSEENLKKYINAELGESCEVAAENATAKVEDNKVVLVKAKKGGTCQVSDVESKLKDVAPRPDLIARVTIPVEVIEPTIVDTQVVPTIEAINQRLEGPIAVTAGDKAENLNASDVRSWLQFSSEGDTFTVSLSSEKAQDVLAKQLAPHVTKAAGITKVSTYDFVETARVNGTPGSGLNTNETLSNIVRYLTKEEDAVAAAVTPVAPKLEYARSYSPTDNGLSALIKNYAESHPGVYGVSLVELSGQRRRAAYQDSKQFTTASTYKLYVAYSTLKRVENGQFAWSDQISGGRNLEKCFDDMIVLSDNPCAEALVKKIGYRPLTNEAVALGASRTTFVDLESYKTTAGDLSTVLAQLETGQIDLSAASRQKLLSAMKRNVYRKGIPAGASGAVADKVGFLNALLHDTAIVYSPSGTYVLTVMTDGSSWASIADLTKQIESLRAQ